MPGPTKFDSNVAWGRLYQGLDSALAGLKRLGDWTTPKAKPGVPPPITGTASFDLPAIREGADWLADKVDPPQGEGGFGRGLAAGAIQGLGGFLSHGDVLPAAAGPLGAAGPELENTTGALKGIPGTYSRLGRAMEVLPEKGSIHPNKVKSLAASQASSEEVNFRGLNDLLKGKEQSGVTKQQVQQHLAAHPLDVETKTYGEPLEVDPNAPDPSTWFYRKYARRPTSDELLDNTYRREYLQDNSIAGNGEPTQHSSSTYQLPGAEPGSYRETIFQMNRPGDHREIPQNIVKAFYDNGEETARTYGATDDQIRMLQDGIDLRKVRPDYMTSHWPNEPNVLAHTRFNERVLPDSPEALRMNDLGSRRVSDMSPEEALTSHQEYNQLKKQSPGSRGRFVEEVQSDWHQQGREEGYKQPVDPSEISRLAMVNDVAGNKYHEAVSKALSDIGFDPEWGNHEEVLDSLQTMLDHPLGMPDANGRPVTPAYHQMVQNHITNVERLRETQSAAWDDYQRAADALHGKGVPDAPFKESWPDLVLKKHLLDVAKDPNLEWLGLTSGDTQAQRWNMAHHFDSLDYHWRPEGMADNSHGWESIDTSVGPEKGDPKGHWVLTPRDANGSTLNETEAIPDSELHHWVGQKTADYLRQHRNRQAVGPDSPHTNLADAGEQSGQIDNQGLLSSSSGRGMKNFYDVMLPNKLKKLLKPFGGQVEKGQLPGAKTFTEASPGRYVRVPLDTTHPNTAGYTSHIYRNQAGVAAETGMGEHVASTWPLIKRYPGASNEAELQGHVLADLIKKQSVGQPHGTPMWYAKLSPEMKQAILKKGFPLLSLLGLASAGQGDQNAR